MKASMNAGWYAFVRKVDDLRGVSTLRTLSGLGSWSDRLTFGRYVVESRLGIPNHGLLAPVGTEAQFVREGYVFEPRDGTVDRDVLGPFNEVQTWSGLRRRLRAEPAGGVFLDVGAHCGSISIPFESFFDRVVSVEPLPDNFRALERNVTLNRLQGKIRPLNVAAGAAHTKATLFVDHDDMPSLVPNHAPGGTLEVEVRPLDEILTDEGIRPPDVRLLKIDVEGAELDVLAGSRRLLEEGAPLVVLEAVTPEARRSQEAHMARLGYTLLRVADTRNLIFARAPDSAGLVRNLLERLLRSRS